MTTQHDGRSWRGNVRYDQMEGNCRIEGDALIDGTLGCRIALHDLDSQRDFRVQQRYNHQFSLFVLNCPKLRPISHLGLRWITVSIPLLS